MRLHPLGLVLLRRASECSLRHLSNLAPRMGPILSGSYRVASRVANSWQAGYPIRSYAELRECRTLFVACNSERIPRLVGELMAELDGFRDRRLVFWDEPPPHREASLLQQQAAGFGIVMLFEELPVPVYLVEGDRATRRWLVEFVHEGGGDAIEIAEGAYALCQLARLVSSLGVAPALDVSFRCLRQAGVSATQANRLLGKKIDAALRAYSQSGMRGLSWPRRAEERRVLAQCVTAVSQRDRSLAAMAADVLRLALRCAKQDTSQLESVSVAVAKAGSGSRA